MSALDDIRQRAEAATTGPWKASDFGHPGDEEPSCIIVHQGDFNWRAIDDGVYVAALPAWDSQEGSDAEFIAHARTDIPRLLGALDAVLALHMEDEQGKCTECTVAPFSVHSVKWPCPTVAAVNDALEAAK